MSKELELVKPLFENVREEELEGRPVWSGRIGKHEVMLMQCGIGKVNSALNAYRLIRNFKPELVLNTGVAGGADRSMKIGSLLVADNVAYHDVWCGPGTQWGGADGFDVLMGTFAPVVDMARKVLNVFDPRFGLICSGDTFISKAEEIRRIKELFPDALACDMESASIAQVCVESGIPFNILRVVSDTPGEGENISQYKDFWAEAPRKTFEALFILLKAL